MYLVYELLGFTAFRSISVENKKFKKSKFGKILTACLYKRLNLKMYLWTQHDFTELSFFF
jgi:hypothetical protein